MSLHGQHCTNNSGRCHDLGLQPGPWDGETRQPGEHVAVRAEGPGSGVRYTEAKQHPAGSLNFRLVYACFIISSLTKYSACPSLCGTQGTSTGDGTSSGGTRTPCSPAVLSDDTLKVRALPFVQGHKDCIDVISFSSHSNPEQTSSAPFPDGAQRSAASRRGPSCTMGRHGALRQRGTSSHGNMGA